MNAEIRWDRPLLAAALCCGMGLGSTLGLSAVRDGLMTGWPNFGAVYPVVRMSTATLAIGVGLLASRLLARFRPGAFLRVAFVASALVLAATIAVALADGKLAAVLLWVHTALFNLALSTAFWAMVNERYGPRGTRTVAPAITGALAVGSIFSVLVAYFLKKWTYLLPLFAMEHILCALSTGFFAVPARKSGESVAAAAPGFFRVLRERPYVRRLAALLFLASLTAFLLSFGLQIQVKEALRRIGTDGATSFYAAFNLASWLAAFLAQTLLSRWVIARLGPAGSVAVMHVGVLGAGAGALAIPGLGAICVLRGAEMCFRNSVFRSGYEVLFSPIPPGQRGPTKSAVDVCADSLGDFAGAAILMAFPLLKLAAAFRWNVAATMATTLGGLLAALLIRRMYARELEVGIARRAPSAPQEESTPLWLARERADRAAKPLPALDSASLSQAIADLQQGAPGSETAREFLAGAARRRPGQLLDLLLDSGVDLSARLLIAKALGASPSALAAEGLFLALDSESFAVRRACGRALHNWRQRNSGAAFTEDRVIQAAIREIRDSRPLWDHALSLSPPDGASRPDKAAEIIRSRARSGVLQVFTLLGLILPADPLRVAAASLESGDEYLRGIALEYLECVLPPAVCEGLWPYFEAERPRRTRSREELIEELMRISPTIRRRIAEIDDGDEAL